MYTLEQRGSIIIGDALRHGSSHSNNFAKSEEEVEFPKMNLA
jgi:hypothetical protein